MKRLLIWDAREILDNLMLLTEQEQAHLFAAILGYVAEENSKPVFSDRLTELLFNRLKHDIDKDEQHFRSRMA